MSSPPSSPPPPQPPRPSSGPAPAPTSATPAAPTPATPSPATPGPASPAAARRSPPALVTSVVFGAIGSVLLLAGLFTGGSEPLVLSAVAAGTLSLISVLVWREQLIAAWRRDRGKGR